MSKRLVWVVAGALLALGAGIGLTSQVVSHHPSKPSSNLSPRITPAPPILGNYDQYLYAITSLKSQTAKMAQFDPSLPADDNLVVNILKQLARDAYGVVIGPDIGPTVETIHEVNFVTFTVGRDKVLFELYRNSSGQVGNVHFSKQTVAN